jgi:hypothetical protein
MEEFHAMTHDPNRGLRGATGILIVAAMVFLFVAGIGAATSYLDDSREVTGSGDTILSSPSRSQSNDETLQRLADYAKSLF